MTLRHMLVWSITLIVIVIAGFLIYSAFYRPHTHQLNSEIQLIGIIPNEDDKNITSNSVLNGDVSILVVDHTTLLNQHITQQIPQAKFFDFDELFNVNNLHLFDKNGDGWLTVQDPIFQHLFIIKFYDKGQQNDIKTLSAAGIKGIKATVTAKSNHEVLMSDNTTRLLYDDGKFEKTDKAVKKEN